MAAAAVVAAVPWKQILVLLPDVAKAAKSVWKQWDSKPKAAPIDPTASVTAQIQAIAERLQSLETSEKNQSHVVSQIADQLEGLATGIKETAGRQTLLFRLSYGSIAIAAAAVVVAVIK